MQQFTFKYVYYGNCGPMIKEKLDNYLKELGAQIGEQSESTIRGIGFDTMLTNQAGEKQYFMVVEKQESTDVYSPKGNINRKVDEIMRVKRHIHNTYHFAIAVPNDQRHHQIIQEKLALVGEGIDAYLVGDDVIKI